MGDPAPWHNTTAVYHPRKPTDSPLYHLLESHFDHFEQIYDERFDRDYGFYRPVISDVVRAYLKCGDLKQGFARVRCPDCHYEYLLAFSCRGRWFPESRSSLTFPHAMLKRLSNSVKCYGKISFIQYLTANMSSASQSFCANFFFTIVACCRNSQNARRTASSAFYALPLDWKMVSAAQ